MVSILVPHFLMFFILKQIETTGLADPAPVVQTFFIDEEIKEMYKLDSVITVVDAKYIIERLDEKKPEGVENEAVEQVVFADKVRIEEYHDHAHV